MFNPQPSPWDRAQLARVVRFLYREANEAGDLYFKADAVMVHRLIFDGAGWDIERVATHSLHGAE